MFKKILLPADLAEPDMTRQATDKGVALGKASGAALRFVTVQAVVPVVAEYQHLASQDQIDAFAATIDYPKELVSTVVRFGAAYHEVLIEAEEWGADLILLSSHRPSMSTYLLGSNAAKIVRHAGCSVLVLR
ncbi:MAG TPA: universal stress protein [Methylocystis sp.]|nr:universal stress protein [Methylocystis sp.]